MKEDTIYRPALYIGSFAVEDQDSLKRVQRVQSELELLRTFSRSKAVLICVSIRGIKICSNDLKVVYMAHALRRVSYATCDATYRQVAFLAREPLGVDYLQYCHVFITATSTHAEELNRVIGDAFKFAYVHQRLVKLQHSTDSYSLTNSDDFKNAPQLTDRYSVWLNESEENPQSINTIDLPPVPPTAPPSHLMEKSMRSPYNIQPNNLDRGTVNNDNAILLDCKSTNNTNCDQTTIYKPSDVDHSTVANKRLIGCESIKSTPLDLPSLASSSTSSSPPSSSTAAVTVPNHSVEHKLSTQSDSAMIASSDPQKRISPTDMDESDKKFNRISTPQVMDLAFLRRHFLRRSGGKTNSKNDNSTNVNGGGNRQTRVRHGSAITSLFASARHSAFFPSFQTSDSKESLSNSSKSLNSPTDPDVAELLNNPIIHRRPPIFVDLRTFAGGSPVVALKERLDAQAIADAKASAFAEAAAVLAAAKKVSEAQTTSSSTPNNTNRSLQTQPPHSVANCIKNTASSDVVEQTGSSNSNTNETEDCHSSPPIPPIRMHSLQRNTDLTPMRQFCTNLCTSTPLCEDLSDEFVDRAISHTRPSTSVTGQPQLQRQRQSLILLDQTLTTHLSHPVSCPNVTSQSLLSTNNCKNISNYPSSNFPVTFTSHPSSLSSPPAADQSRPVHSSLLSATDNQIHGKISTTALPFDSYGVNKLSQQQFQCQQTPVTIDNDSINPVRFANVAKNPLSNLTNHATASSFSSGNNNNNSLSSTSTPLHVIAGPMKPIDHSVDKHASLNLVGGDNFCNYRPTPADPVFTNLTSSTLSTETPTPTATPTPTPEQNSHLLFGGFSDESQFLKHAPWYQAFLPREIAFELLAREEIGSFLVRNSATHPGCCALSVRVPVHDNPTGITHYLIQKTQYGVRLKGLDKEWPSLQALVTHLTVIPEMLPCPLRLPAHTANPTFTQTDSQALDQLNETASKFGPAELISTGCTNSHRILHPVADLPCRPVPPTCAGLVPLTSTDMGTNYKQAPTCCDKSSPPNSNQLTQQTRHSVSQKLTSNLTDDSVVITRSTKPRKLSEQNRNSLATTTQAVHLVRHLSDDMDNRHTIDQLKNTTNTNDTSPNCALSMNCVTTDSSNSSVPSQVNHKRPDYDDQCLADGEKDRRRMNTNDNKLLSRVNNNNNNNNDINEDEDYQRLSDFSSILADLNLTS